VSGLMDNLLVTKSPPAGEMRFSEWAKENVQFLGTKYASELERHYRSNVLKG
jgi:hypothetical protein